MEKLCKKYFLGANSCTGFVSEFANSYNADDGWHAYIIKGGPGTGKSSFMKRVAESAADKGLDVELCICSSDPQSLDGIIIESLKTVILDGTSPHIVEPLFPGVCETILNFSEFWNEDSFKGNESTVLEITRRNKALHRVAARYMSAVGQLMTDNLKIADACTDRRKAEHFARSLCKRYIPQKPGYGHEWVRFIQGITPDGIVSYSESLKARTVVVISDEYGSASGIIMETIRKYALDNSQEIITLKSPFLPESITDHIILPELSLVFATENCYIKPKTNLRHIHARRFVNTKQLHKSRGRIAFNKKATEQLLKNAVISLKNAKSVHDELEQYYISAMNFNKADEYTDEFIDKLLS